MTLRSSSLFLTSVGKNILKKNKNKQVNKNKLLSVRKQLPVKDCSIQTIKPISSANQVPGFYLTQPFTEMHFQTDPNNISCIM